MNNENNNGVIDFDDSVFLNNSSNENLNTTTKTVNNNQALDASTLNVDDVFVKHDEKYVHTVVPNI